MDDELQSVMQVIRRNVAEAIVRAGIGLKPFAKQNGMGETVVRDLVKGYNSDVQLGTLAKIAKGAGVQLVDLIRMNEPVTNSIPQQALARAIADALPELPQDEARRIEYLTSTVIRVLALPSGLPDEPANDEKPAARSASKVSPPRRSTKKA